MEIKHLTPEYFNGLIKLQEENEEEFKYFTPHKFNKEVLSIITGQAKKDVYYVAVYNGEVVGYVMLRGMDEGYSVPRLGIGIDKHFYGTGLGSLLMSFLETTARIHGYTKMGLRVYKDNKRAYQFYLKLGYDYAPYDDESVLGIKEL